MAELNKYMNKAFEYEEKGYVEEAIQLCTPPAGRDPPPLPEAALRAA